MPAFDARWIRLLVVAGAIVGSALVSSAALATDGPPPSEPPAADVGSSDDDPSGAEVVVVDPPLDDGVVVEIVLPDLDLIGPAGVASKDAEGTPLDEPSVATPEWLPAASTAVEPSD